MAKPSGRGWFASSKRDRGGCRSRATRSRASLLGVRSLRGELLEKRVLLSIQGLAPDDAAQENLMLRVLADPGARASTPTTVQASPSPPAVANSAQVSLSSVAIANVLVNNPSLDSTSASDTQSETTLINFGSTVLVGFNDSHSNLVSSNKFTGFSRSTDGGQTFTDMGELPTSLLGDVGDPGLARENVSGTIYFATLGYPSAGSGTTMPGFPSTDGGATFLAPG